MTSVPHSGAKSVTPGGSVAGGHTQGEWRIHGCEISSDMGLIGTVYWSSGQREGEHEANKALIASAPDLLKACADWIGWLDPSCPMDEDAHIREREMLDAMRAAIAKATAGEARNAEPIHRRDGDSA